MQHVGATTKIWCWW